MYRSTQHNSSFSGPPPPPQSRRSPGYDGYDAYGPPPPPPPSLSQRWDRRDGRDSRHDNGHSRNQFRGPYSDLRQSHHNSRYDFQPPRGEFTFRQEAPPGINSYRPPAPHRYGAYHPGNQHHLTYPNNSRGDREGGSTYAPRREESRRPRGGHRSNQSRRPAPFQPHERGKAAHRPLLSTRFDGQPELMLGDTTVRATYRDVDELSDSDEVDMDISDNGDSDSNGNIPDRPAKRARTTDSDKTATTVPKWSNPDPYTALPPPETTRKKDVVQLIRKARVQAEAKQTIAPAEAADFISCDFTDDEAPSQARNEATSKSSAKPENPHSIIEIVKATHSRASLSTLPPKPPASIQIPPTATQNSPITAHNPLIKTQIQDLQRTDPVQPTLSPAANHISSLSIHLTPSTSLGNRKRTIDDVIKLPHEPLRKVNRMAPRGAVLLEWCPVEDEDPCPWAVVNHAATPNAGTRLHKEICDFYEYVRPRDFEEKLRRQLVKNLQALVAMKWRDARVFPFGSFMSGLYLPTADMDIAICSKGFTDGKSPFYDKKKYLYHMKNHLDVHGVAYQNQIEAIARAKVPLLKYRDDYTGLRVDISFEKMDGYKAVDTFLQWKRQYPAMPPLVAVIKHFLLMRGLNEPVNGGIGGFTVICMVIHVLQMMPQVQSGSMKAEHHLGEILMEFLDYYGNRFNFETVAIRMNPPGIVNKAAVSSVVYRNLDRLSIIDPNNSENDISGGSSNYCMIRSRFQEAYTALQEAMMRSAKDANSNLSNGVEDTLLYPLFAGNYSHFRRQREWLQNLANRSRPERENSAAAKGTR
ncbi:hypothetical protein GGS21DRAFT_528210 [Xylaria nigripes]|nr:hypothetical protein GGS21DRAFT_528210 [Xylaria nigripes]